MRGRRREVEAARELAEQLVCALCGEPAALALLIGPDDDVRRWWSAGSAGLLGDPGERHERAAPEVRDALREHDCRPGDGDRFNCRCPAHDDRSPSLSVAVGADGRVLMTCQAGCAFEDVVAKLGLETSDLFVARNGDSADRRIAATYDYVDEQGALLYQVVRYEPKDFRQRRPGTNGEEWVWNLRGVRRVLYRLPKVVEAIKAKQTVWLTEGERDVHSLEDRGVTATTCAMGAGKGKWRGEYTEALRGAHVVIVGDNDELGQEHGAARRREAEGQGGGPRSR